MSGMLALTSWSAVSSLGIGQPAFSRNIHSTNDSVATELGLAVPGFDIPQLLGPKNTRAMDRLTGLTVVAVGRLLESEAGDHDEGTGLVLGITTGSIQSMMDFTRDSFTRAKPYLVDPARFPNGVMNRAAGQSAIWYGLRGPNATIASGQVAGLSALRYAARLLRSGHVTSVLCGAVEELSEQRVWLEHQRRDSPEAVTLGEGCAVLRLEMLEHAASHGRTALAYLGATAFRVYQHNDNIPATLTECVTAVLKTAGAAAQDVWAVAADLPDAHYAGVREVLGDRPRRLRLEERIGDTGAASAALQVAGVLAHADADEASRGRLALVASVDRDGLAGVAALRVPPRSLP